MRRWWLPITCVAVVLCIVAPSDAEPQNPPVYLQLSPTVKAVLYAPDASVKSRVAIVNMHEDGSRLA